MYIRFLLFFKYVIESFLNTKRYRLTRKTILYLESASCKLPLQDKKEIMEYLRYSLISQINYSFRNKYLTQKIKLTKDKSNGLFYVNHKGKRLYFKRELSKRTIKDLYRCLCIEQDKDSPHSYSFGEMSFQNEIVADIGAAEGIWGLSLIESVKTLYLFECDEGWIEALNLTFSPWKEKVRIINKYVSDNSEGCMIRLDDYFYEKGINLFTIKADIEGAEEVMLKGAEKMIQDGVLKKIIVCSYHHPNDEEMISEVLGDNYLLSISKGYMLDVYSDVDYDSIDISSIFRKGVIYAKYKH